MNNPIRILSTKKLLFNQKQFLLNVGFCLSELDFIDIKLLDFSLPEIHGKTLIFTSQNAVKSVLNHSDNILLKSENVLCVGIKTKKLLEENGFHVEVCTDYVADLAEIITKHYSDGNFIFFCGNLRHDTLPNTFKDERMSFEEICVYETILTPHQITDKADGILFFSPSGIESYLQKNDITDEVCFCIGSTTAKALKDITKNTIIIEKPSVENVLYEVKEYFLKRNAKHKI
ncbi:MAG TPA: uroporphyrinogen-III synthase [Flavobacterium sp.]|nr:uroporphyrinogen-III synthase [Flavobacterium sp.]